MNNIQVILAPPKNYLEIFQKNNIKFSFVEKVNKTLYKQLHYFILCRDFLGDALYSIKYNKYISIYGFTWKPENKIQTDKLRLYIYFPNINYINSLKENIHILNTIEKNNKFSKTKLIQVDDNNLIIEGSIQWTKRLWTLSLYTYLLKVFSINSDFEKLTGTELNYYKQTKESLLTLLTSNNIKNWINKTPFIFNTNSTYDIHNNNGFVSFLQNYKNE